MVISADCNGRAFFEAVGEDVGYCCWLDWVKRGCSGTDGYFE